MGIGRTDLLLVLRARDEMSRTIHAVGRSMRSLDKDALAAANSQIERGRALTSVGVGLVAAGAAGFYALEKMGKSSRDYSASAALALTQTDNVGASLKDLKKIGLDVAKTIPVAIEQIQPALYDIFSSVDTNLNGARVLIKQFAKDAIAGGTDMQTATRSNLQVMNAYNLKVKDVSKVSDFMFQLVRKGVGDYKQMTAAIGKSIPSAARAGQSFFELGGMIAHMTRNGLTAAQAGTSAARAMDAIANPKTLANMKKMGINILDANGNFADMSTIVPRINEKLKGLSESAKASKLKDMFAQSGGTIQAMRFFNTVTKNDKVMAQYLKRVKEMKNSKGAAGEAFNIMKGTDTAKLQLLNNRFAALKIELGDIYNNVRTKVVTALLILTDIFGKMPDKLKKAIVYITLIGSALAVVVGVGLIFAGLFMMISATMAILGITLSGIALAVAVVVGVVAGLAVAGYLIYKNWATLKPFFEAIWNAILDGGKQAWAWLVANFGSKSDFGKGVINAFNVVKDKFFELADNFKGFAPLLASVGSSIATVFHGIVNIVGQAIMTLMPIFNAIVTIIKQVFFSIFAIIAGAIQVIKGVLQVLVGIFTGNFGMIKEGVLNILKGLWTAVSGVFSAAFHAIVALVSGFVKSILKFFIFLWDELVGHSIIPDMINAIVNWFKGLPGRVLGIIAGFVGGLINRFINLWINIRNTFSTGISRVVSFVKELPGKMYTALTSGTSKLYDAAVNMIQGFINGIGTMVKSVVGKAKDLAGKAVGAITGLLRTGSPSKLMIQIGRYVGQGLVIGLTGSQKQVASAARALANKIITSIRKKGLSKATAMKAVKILDKLDNALLTNAKRRERLVPKLKAAKDRLDAVLKESADFSKTIADGLRSFAAITGIKDAFGDTQFLTKDDLITGLQSRLASIKDYQAKLKDLLSRGLNQDLYKQLLDAGIEGGAGVINALQGASAEDIAKINDLNNQIVAASGSMGNAAAKEMFGAGVASAQGFYDGLLANQKALEAAAVTLAQALIKKIRAELGIRSPSKVFSAIGKNLSLALAGGMRSQLASVVAAATSITKAASIDPSVNMGTYSSSAPYQGSSTPPVVPPNQGPAVYQEITVNTQEIDPRKHAAELGFELFARMT